MADILISKFTTQIPRVGATPATPGFAESEGQDPVAPSGTPQVYTPVTIGSPANGLSISGTQVLTIGLASTSATGALSSTDWNTFNGKIGGTIASGQVAFGTGVNTVGGDADFVWDSTNNRLRINTSDTTANLSIGGSLNVTDGTVIIRSIIVGTDGAFGTNTNHNLVFRTNSTSRWSILTSGILESNGSQTIRTSTGDLAIQTGAANGNIIIIPNGTGIAQIKTSGTGANLVVGNSLNVTDLTTTIRSVVSAGVGFFGTSSNHPLVLRTNASNRLRILETGEVGIGDITPTNTLDVNGTARIRTINNLGSAATSVLVPSATGVLSLRTLAELASDGLGSKWINSGAGIYRNSEVGIGFAGINSTTALTINSLVPAIDTGSPILLVRNIASADRFEIENSGAVIITTNLTTGSALKIIDNLAATNIDIRANGSVTINNSNAIISMGATVSIPQNGEFRFTRAVNSAAVFTFSANAGTILQGLATGEIILRDTAILTTGTSVGLKIAGATNQKLGFFNATPIVQPSGDILTALSNLGLIASPTITQVDQFAVKTTASADQTLPSGTLTILDYDSTLLNNSTATYTVATDGRITINTTGVYTITAGVVIEADAVTALESAFLGIFRNGDLVAISSINTTIAAGAQSGLSTSTILSLTATDIIDCRALVNSVGGVANGLARRLGTLLGANATQVNSLSITKNSM